MGGGGAPRVECPCRACANKGPMRHAHTYASPDDDRAKEARAPLHNQREAPLCSESATPCHRTQALSLTPRSARALAKASKVGCPSCALAGGGPACGGNAHARAQDRGTPTTTMRRQAPTSYVKDTATILRRPNCLRICTNDERRHRCELTLMHKHSRTFTRSFPAFPAPGWVTTPATRDETKLEMAPRCICE